MMNSYKFLSWISVPLDYLFVFSAETFQSEDLLVVAPRDVSYLLINLPSLLGVAEPWVQRIVQVLHFINELANEKFINYLNGRNLNCTKLSIPTYQFKTSIRDLTVDTFCQQEYITNIAVQYFWATCEKWVVMKRMFYTMSYSSKIVSTYISYTSFYFRRHLIFT